MDGDDDDWLNLRTTQVTLSPSSPNEANQSRITETMLPLPAASFAVPSTVSVSEGGAATSVCVEMTAIPANATLAKEVVVTLSTRDGTGTGDEQGGSEC